MSDSTISGTITIGVTLGAGFDDELTLTKTGEILPASEETDGVYAKDGTILNYGRIGGYAGGSIGGTGVNIGNGSLTNNGTIAGGAAGAGLYSGTTNTGGTGLEVGGGTILNTGLISGGAGPVSFVYDFRPFIYGRSSGVGLSQSGGSTTNTGTIIGGASIAAFSSIPGYTYASTFSAGGDGAELSGGSLLNNSLIVGGYGLGIGVEVSGGSMTNDGMVIGGVEAEGVSLSAGTVLNNGTITAGGYYARLAQTDGLDGVDQTGGTLINVGLISGSNARAFLDEGLTDVKAGFGVYASGGTVINLGTISAGQGGLNNNTFLDPIADVGVVLGNGTLITGGLVKGGIDELGNQNSAVALFTSSAVVIVQPGAAFTGAVIGFGDNLIELATGTTETTGTLSMGGSFSGFGTISFASGVTWELDGTVDELAAGQTISGFANGDTLALSNWIATSDTYVSGIGLELDDGTVTETLDVTGGFSTASFLVTDSAGNTDIELEPAICYLRGTRILTPAGEVAVEDLAIGDPVVSRFSGYRRIKWIGRQSYSARFIGRDQIPVRIAAGAFGSNLPKRDLLVSPGHSMLLGGVLILATHLVNGVTITQPSPPDEVHYYQLEFETHDCVLAEGAWSESFCDYASLRNQFHNVAAFHALYPDHVTPVEHLMCAQRPEAGPALAAALAPIAARAVACTTPGLLHGWIDDISPTGTITGWAQDTANPELPVLLEIQVHGRWLGTILACNYRQDLAAANIGQGRCAFSFCGPELDTKLFRSIHVHRVGHHEKLPFAPHCLMDSTKIRRARKTRASRRA